jgi:hypothetical protein
VEPGRLVVKQARSLDPGVRGVPAQVLGLPIPRDIVARARNIDRITCPSGDDTIFAVEVLTDPLLAPDVGYAGSPYLHESDPDAVIDGDCDRETLYSIPDHFLFDLLETGTLLDL